MFSASRWLFGRLSSFFSFCHLAQASSSTSSSSTTLMMRQVSFEGARLCDARVWSVLPQVADMCSFVVFVRDPRMDEAHRKRNGTRANMASADAS